jgi:cation:H+ antiporter
MVAAVKKETEVALGTIVGSNIFNLLAIMGIATLVSPTWIEIPWTFPWLDFPVMLVSALVVTFYIWLRRPLGRVAGIIMCGAYVSYVTALFVLA